MNTQKTTRQAADTVESNALRLDTEKAEQIIDALNTDLADAYVLYHQLHKHHWNVEGAGSSMSTSSSKRSTRTSKPRPTNSQSDSRRSAAFHTRA